MREEDEEAEERKRKRTKRSLCLCVNLASPGRFSQGRREGRRGLKLELMSANDAEIIFAVSMRRR